MPSPGENPQPTSRRDERLPKSARVRKRGEYLRLQRIGKRRGSDRLVVLCGRSTTGLSRIGITASRKVGNAVVRNRVKRFIREFFRRHKYAIEPPQDFVVIVRAAAATTSYAEVSADLARALRIESDS